VDNLIINGSGRGERAFFGLMHLSLACVCLSLLLMTFSADAASSWKNQRYERFVKDENLVTLLMDFSSTLNVPMVVSDKVRVGITERVNGHFKGLTAEAFLTKLSTLYQITWYFDGHVLFIYHSDEVQTSLVYVDGPRAANLHKTLVNLGIYDPRFKWRMVETENIVFVSGPPRYLQLLQEVAQLLQRRYQQNEVFTVRVFPLRYASAADQRLQHRGQTTVVPGVATLLKQILGRYTNLKIQTGESAAPAAKKADTSALGGSLFGMAGREALKGSGLSPSASDSSSSQLEKINVNPAPSQVTIEADGVNNTIIVHDHEDRMSMYEELIASFDKPSEQIEIEVSIVEVSSDRINELGVDWQLRDGNGSFGVGDVTSPVRNTGGTILSPDAGNLTMILQNNGNYFLGRIRALSENGEGQVLSRPSIITMNNQQAIIDNTTTFYVRLEGQEEVDLVPVTVGSVLSVTPRVIDESGSRKIMLNVAIEDGQNTAQGGEQAQVDGLPTVSRSTITTQAVIEENSSLLVGGFFLDQRRSTEEKVPVLGDIPGLGLLFRSESKERQKNARLFMISPRIVKEQLHYDDAQPLKEILDKHQNFHNADYEKPDYFIYE